jgi:hypothetical protein
VCNSRFISLRIAANDSEAVRKRIASLRPAISLLGNVLGTQFGCQPSEFNGCCARRAAARLGMRARCPWEPPSAYRYFTQRSEYFYSAGLGTLQAGRGPHEPSSQSVGSFQMQSPLFTPKQGQYLAFIYAYTQVLGRPPAEADIQRHFKVTAPTVHQMVITLERTGLIRRRPGVARSIELVVSPESLPVLR